MEKETAQTAGGICPNLNLPSTFIEAGKNVIQLDDAFATKVSCDIFKFLSIKEFHTHFIERRDTTSFNALHCNLLDFTVMVKADAVEDDVRHNKVDFFLNDHARHNPLIHLEEEDWKLFCRGKEVGKIEPRLSVKDEMKVRFMAEGAFRALKRALRKKAEADLLELHFQFGRPTSGHWAGKLVLAGAITSNECRVFKEGSARNFRCAELSLLTDNLFL